MKNVSVKRISWKQQAMKRYKWTMKSGDKIEILFPLFQEIVHHLLGCYQQNEAD